MRRIEIELSESIGRYKAGNIVNGWFHKFATDNDTLVAVCELESGMVVLNEPNKIIFLDKPEQENKMEVSYPAPTLAQMNVIRRIEKNLGILFTGKTLMEAREFISDNIEASKKACEGSKSKINRGYDNDSDCFPYGKPFGEDEDELPFNDEEEEVDQYEN